MEEEKQKNKEDIEENRNKVANSHHENQLKWMIIIIVGIGIVFILIAFSISKPKQIESGGIKWNKEMFGEIPIYTVIVNGYGAHGMPIKFKAVLRNDPRKLEEIKWDGDKGFVLGQPIYFSLDMEQKIYECDGSIGLIGFGQFMANMGFEIITAIKTPDLAEEYQRPFADCTSHLGNTVIILTRGNETKITQSQENINCYTLTFKDCEDIKVLEKFEIEVLSMFVKRGAII